MPAIVCAAVRLVGVTTPSPPSSTTSSKASAYARLPRDGGGGVRNCDADWIANGRTWLQRAPSASGIWLIGSCCQCGGTSLVMYSIPTRGSRCMEPSLARTARICAAASLPTATPRAFSRLSDS
jgi:hypothetical protein